MRQAGAVVSRGVRLLSAALTVLLAAPTPTLEGGPLAVRWMAPAKLGGAIPTGREREPFALEARPCGRAWETVTDFHSGPGGRWQLDVYPPITTTYRVRWSGRTSRTLTVRVRPSVVLRPDGGGRFVASITAARDFDGRTGSLERLDRRTGRYVRVKTIRFDDAGPAGQMRVSTAHVRATIARGTRVRAVFPKSACYLVGFSNALKT
jgi:hypothetical protein